MLRDDLILLPLVQKFYAFGEQLSCSTVSIMAYKENDNSIPNHSPFFSLLLLLFRVSRFTFRFFSNFICPKHLTFLTLCVHVFATFVTVNRCFGIVFVVFSGFFSSSNIRYNSWSYYLSSKRYCNVAWTTMTPTANDSPF